MWRLTLIMTVHMKQLILLVNFVTVKRRTDVFVWRLYYVFRY